MVTRVTCPHCGQRCQVEISQDEQALTCSVCGQMYLPNEQERLPEHIGRFRIDGFLGAGANGTVYLAHDRLLDRSVALKVLRSDASGGGKARVRFLREAKAAAQLHHPNIIPVFDVGTDGHVDYHASEYIPGRTLEDELQDHDRDWAWAADVCRKLADALAYAHHLGIIHRDVKSNNVMVDQNGDVHLTDFGLARQLNSDEKLTKDGAILGTVAYMAPEQASPDIGPVGHYSDQYSLGIILYELLCGEPPFRGPAAVVLYNCIHTEPAAPHTIVPDVPRDLEAICLKAIAKRPEDRYANCAEFAEDLRCWLAGEPLLACPIGHFERLSRWAKRNPWIAGLAAAAASLTLILSAVAFAVLLRVKEEDRVLSQLLKEKDSGLRKVQATEGDIRQLEEDISDLGIRTTELVEENSRIIADIESRRQDLQQESRQKLNQFLEKSLAEWVFMQDTGHLTDPADKLAEPTRAIADLPHVIDPPWPGVSTRGEALTSQAGEPFGVGVLAIQFSKDSVRWRPDELIRLSGRRDAVYYPAYAPQAGRSENGTPDMLRSLDVYFLFHGHEPLELTLEVGPDCVYRTTLPVTPGAARHTLRMDQWWARFVRSSGDPAGLTSGPPSKVRSYLVRMLAHRLDRPLTADDASHLLGFYDGYLRSYRDLLTSEASDDKILRLADILPWQEAAVRHWQYEAWNSPSEFGPQGEAGPNLHWSSTEHNSAPVVPDAVSDEMAMFVPQECYYARFANPQDVLTFVFGLDRLTGGLRLFDGASVPGADLGQRLLRQLGLDAIAVGYGMAEGLISDVAVIGTDVHFQDGAAVGVLVKASDSELLGALIDLMRERVLAVSPGVQTTDIMVGTHTVSLLQTEDKSVRSFYAASGDIHLISNSKHLVRRFFEAEQGVGSLAQNPSFQVASRSFHAEQNESFQLFVSEDFWKQTFGAPSVIETFRRYRARADLELVRLARLTAESEAIPYDDIQDLIRAKVLPESVVMRPDQSRPQMDNGILSDSLRGLPGTFLPIPDVIEGAGNEDRQLSAFEADLCRAYARKDSYAMATIDRLGPLVITASSPSRDASGGESISLDVQFTSPLRELLARALEQPEMVQLLGPGRNLEDLLRPPSQTRIAPLPGDLAFVEIAFRTDAWRTFFGLREWEIPHRICNGKFEPDQAESIHELASFYIGETATKGLLGRLTQGGYSSEDADGHATSVSDVGEPLPFRRRYGNEWIAFSPQKETLAMVSERPIAESGYPPAQMRIHLGSIFQSKLAATLRALAYLHARRLSGANALLLEELQHQLHLLPSEALTAAHEYYRGSLACPLDGRYQWNKTGWTGTAWSQPSLYDETKIPDDYSLPLVDALRGADISIQLAEEQINAHLEIKFIPD